MKPPPKSRMSLCWFLVLAWLAILAEIAKAQDDNKIMSECQGVQLDIVEEHALSIGGCLKGYNATSIKDIKPSDTACLGKCILESTGLIDAEGKPHKENIFKMITDMLPPKVHDDIQRKFEQCIDEEGDALDPTEESCVSYLPLMMCFHIAFMEECM